MIFIVKRALIDAAVEWFGVPGKAVVASIQDDERR